MEFSASFPVDLTQLVEGLAAPGGAAPAPGQPGREFAGVLAGQVPDEAADQPVTMGGETLPQGGDGLPLAATLMPLPVMDVAAMVAVVPAAGAQAPSPDGGLRATSPIPSLSALPAAIAAALETPTNIGAAGAAAGAAMSEGAAQAGTVSLSPAAPPGSPAESLAASPAAPPPAAPLPSGRATIAPDVAVSPTPPAAAVADAGIDAVAVEAGVDTGTGGDADGPADESAADNAPQLPQSRAASVAVRADAGPAAAAPVDATLGAEHAFTVSSVGASRSEPLPPAAASIPDGMQQFDLEPGADMDQVATRIRWLADRQIGEARIRLNPPELGALDIRLSVVDDETFVQITAHGAGTRELLEGAIPKLRALLGAGGLSLGGASIDGGQSGHADHGSRVHEPATLLPPVGGTGEERQTPAQARVVAGRVDLYA
jgi:flagellar hook-length control protein FliK